MTAADGDPRDVASALLSAHPAAAALGVTLVDASKGRATVRLVVGETMVNGHDICHGGIIFGLADLACMVAASATGDEVIARGATVELLNPAPLGAVLDATATVTAARGRGGIYDAAVRTSDGTVVALLRDRLAGRDRTESTAPPGDG